MNHHSRNIINLLPFLSALLVSCGPVPWKDENDADLSDNFIDPTSVVLEEGDFHTALQKAYIHSGYATVWNFASGGAELSVPQPLAIDSLRVLEYSTAMDFSTSTIVTVSGDYLLFNVYADETYYYRTAISSAVLPSASVQTITTTGDLPRNIFIDGVTNVRDIGGYRSKVEGNIRQGLFYRGGELNEGEETPISLLTEDGLSMLKDTLGVKSEIDLRMTVESSGYAENGNLTNGFFPGIQYYSLPIDPDTANMMLDRKAEVAAVFRLLADVDNYPVYLHCAIGTDRTGMIAYVLGALLGMGYSELYHDYLFSNFGNIGSKRNPSAPRDKYQAGLKTYGKDNLYACAKAYLLDCGLTKNEVSDIQKIFLVD